MTPDDVINTSTLITPPLEIEVVHFSTEDDTPFARRKKRSRADTSKNFAQSNAARPDVEGYIKVVHGASTSCSQSPLVHQVVVMRKRVHNLCNHYAKLEVSKNEAIQLAETVKEMMDKSATTHNKEMCALKEQLNLLNDEYKKKEADDAMNNLVDSLDGFQVVYALQAPYPSDNFDFISNIPVIAPPEDL
ncbi:hypothetical protein JCGZ_05315 [Jatropha curcas]|uniref:Uncharacterized protein n=1 Tax=Jatropha curcas TaxID=180498 RepID=A0A067KUF1_JATCU|nr:hypothetical protein JCGZ_05315 [Jatropha curcas]